MSLLDWLAQVQARQASLFDHEHSALTSIQAWSELDAGDFSRATAAAIDPTSHPDFSTAGAPLHFGIGIDLSWNGQLPDNPFVTDFLVR